jgi:hypothetical protein
MAEALRWGKPLGLQKKMLINNEADRTVSIILFRAALADAFVVLGIRLAFSDK